MYQGKLKFIKEIFTKENHHLPRKKTRFIKEKKEGPFTKEKQNNKETKDRVSTVQQFPEQILEQIPEALSEQMPNFQASYSWRSPNHGNKSRLPSPESLQNCATRSTVGTASFFGGAPCIWAKWGLFVIFPVLCLLANGDTALKS